MIINRIDKKEALRYLGIKGEPDSTTAQLIEQCEKELLEEATPKILFRIFEISDISDQNINLENCSLVLPGEDIKELLTGCEKVAVMCATLGSGADMLIRKMQITDMTRAVITDALASALIEQVCDYAEGEIRKAVGNLCLTDRFSPGYGDLPIELQKELLLVLDAQKKTGLCATDNMLLTPKKSVTAIIGLSQKDKDRIYSNNSCENCRSRSTCRYRKENNYCGKQT